MMTSVAPHALAVNRHTRPMGPGEEKGEGERESKREGEGGKRDREKGGKMAGENQAMNIHSLLMVH